jgi:hypothetical protein
MTWWLYCTIARKERYAAIMTCLSYCSTHGKGCWNYDTQGERCCNYDMIIVLLQAGRGMLQLWHDYNTVASRERDAAIMTWLSYCCSQGEGCCSYDMIIILLHEGRGMLQFWQYYQTAASRKRGVLQSLIRIRKYLNVDLGPAFHLSAESDPDPDPGTKSMRIGIRALLEVKVDVYI